MDRTCLNCQRPVHRNPENPNRWLHEDLIKNCPDGQGKAYPSRIEVHPSITMLLVAGRTVYFRKAAFFAHCNDPDEWTTMRQGVSTRTTTELFENAEYLRQPVHALLKGAKLQ